VWLNAELFTVVTDGAHNYHCNTEN